MAEAKKPMSPVLKAILIYLGAIIFGGLVSSPLGKLYRVLEGPYTSTTLGVIFDENVDSFLGGFIYGYSLFLGLLIGFFVKKVKKEIIIWLIGIAYFIIATLLAGGWNYLMFVILFSLLGFLLAKLVLVIRKSLKKDQTLKS